MKTLSPQLFFIVEAFAFLWKLAKAFLITVNCFRSESFTVQSEKNNIVHQKSHEETFNPLLEAKWNDRLPF